MKGTKSRCYSLDEFIHKNSQIADVFYETFLHNRASGFCSLTSQVKKD